MLQVKKPSLEDAMAGAFMAGADFLPPKKQAHKPLIKFLGKRSLLQERKVIFFRFFFFGSTTPGPCKVGFKKYDRVASVSRS